MINIEKSRKQLGIYIHIPFCVKKCDYCDFLSAPASDEVKEEYVKMLLYEIDQFVPKSVDYMVDTIFIGGGTPSILSGEQIEKIMNKVMVMAQKADSLEITIEVNPGTVTPEKLIAYKRAGINRISIGLQTADNRELSLIGRIHTWEQFQESYDLARQAGFQNINIDVMSALPGQTLESYQRTLEQVIMLHPEHISAYSLIIEEGTPFFIRYQEDEERRKKGEQPVTLPSEEQERRMYEFTKCFLSENGYGRYEISNYAREGFACRHNVGYWKRKDYIGFGLGAASLIQNRRFSQCSELNAYLRGEFSECEQQPLSVKEQMEEFMFLGLRLMEGIKRIDFCTAFHIEIEKIYGKVLHELFLKELLYEYNGRIALTDRGVDVSNYVFEQFLLDIP